MSVFFFYKKKIEITMVEKVRSSEFFVFGRRRERWM